MPLKFWLLCTFMATFMVLQRVTCESSLSNIAAHVPGGFVGDQIEEEEEMMMESAVSLRILAQRVKYISYEALRANNVPCVRSGASYYTCLPRKRINPYRRGCSRITNCYRYY
ncbi:hypothetical protein Tsubulata_007395 [Turnera subulata]|uniref:Uncharacterized protein n=1 Tax=Turnera subulata TaxID=218843 RepID=A0A9Q0F4W0_9ROSI|nr:hypothetical protein Tsubulata_040545 [Turnera subulata]KAJ4828948.1 hypothetical protein Tsubulata_007395 [Turnera subulata]